MALPFYTIVSYGGGVNSTALLVEAVRREMRPDVILFSDTGDERPATYAYVRMFSDWLVAHGFPAIEWVRWIRRDGTFEPLGLYSLRTKALPSKAYGFSGCTVKWKQQPLDRRVQSDPNVLALWGEGEPIVRWIGFDFDEPRRAERMLEKNPQPKQDGRLYYRWEAPLYEWKMGREECEASIAAAGLPSPGKSSCYFCPSMKKHEVRALAKEEPELFARALEIEDAARPGLDTVKGLGRSFSWRDLVAGDAAAACARDVVEADCGCHDGGGE
jgi:hypothetical protein